MLKKAEVKKIIDKHLNNAFKEVLDSQNIKTGDFEPLAAVEYDKCVEKLAQLSIDQVGYNKPYKS